MFPFRDFFTEIAILPLMAASLGALGARLRRPLSAAFIVVGVLAGPKPKVLANVPNFLFSAIAAVTTEFPARCCFD